MESKLKDKSPALNTLLSEQNVLVAPVILHTYIEAYRVVIQGLLTWEIGRPFDEKYFLVHCQYLGGEMQWQGKIQRTESISPPFLINGLRLVKNQDLLPTKTDLKKERLKAFLFKLDQLADIISALKEITLKKNKNSFQLVPIDRAIVPGSRTESITNEILEGESGPHIGAFFDLDRTLIKGFSAKEFFQSRLLSGKMTTKEIVAQFAGVLVYAMGNKNFAGLAAISANGVKGVKEKVFIDVGEEVYLKHLASEIYPESRSLVAAHLAKGHTVAIISAATPYQVNPIARDLGIEHVLCSEMEVEKGIFTGNVIEPPCWGEGKAHAGRTLAEKCNLDLQKSFFYTDSAEDMPLLELVGYPRPLNPDGKLSVIAFENDWPVLRFDDEERSGIADMLRTGLAVGSFIPAIINGIATGSVNMSWKDGINSMMATIGDMGTSFAGIKVAIKGKEHLWSHRPAVFIFNHQSSADLLIAAKLVRKNAVGIAKKELQKVPILGQLMSAAGVIFLDRSDREKAIEALKPAVEALRQDTSIIIAPEGTRSYDYKLGEFKKGAFHIAMQAGVSIVPIIIKNAHDAMPRGTNVFRPSTIEVVVSKPIPTDDWDVKDLENHIAYIRNLYLEELGQVEVVQ